MDIQALENQLNELLAKESLVLTPINVGFKLGIDAEDAVKFLDQLTTDGKMELVSGQGTGATYKQVGKATYQTTPGESSVGKAKNSRALYHLLLNFFIPGLGSLIFGRIALFFFTFLFFAGGIGMIVFLDEWFKLFSILMLVGSWLISFFGSIYYYIKDPWTPKEPPKSFVGG